MMVNIDGTPYKGKGEKYLQTSVAHEYTQIVNMAVDNIKSGILTNTANAKGQNWYTSRIFEVVQFGENITGLTPDHLEILNGIAKLFKYSGLKKMLDANRELMSPGDFINSLRDLERMIKDPEMLKIHIQKITALQNYDTKITKDFGLHLIDVQINDVVTPEEEWLFSILDSYEAYNDDPRVPFNIETSLPKREDVHFLASEAVLADILLNNTFSTEQIDAVKTWVEGPKGKNGVRVGGFNGDYYGVLKDLSQKLGKTDMIDRKAEYDRELFGIVSMYKTKLLDLQMKHGEEAAKLASALVIRGVDVTYRRRLPDGNALHSGVWKDYMETWDSFWDMKDEQLNHKVAELLENDERKKYTVDRIIEKVYKSKGRCI